MEIIKFDRVVSVNSELQGHGVENILDGEISPSKNWMCEKGTERAVAILQLERSAVVTSVHVGNAHSAFVEVLVGRAADGAEKFQSLVPMSVLMNPHESKTGTNPNRTRFFNRAEFNEATAAKSWDRVKIVCSQPFNKHVPYGLCFFKVHGEREGRKVEIPLRADDKDEIQVGSFFKKKRTSVGDKQLSASEQMKEAEKEMMKNAPVGIVQPGTSQEEGEEKLKKLMSKKKEKNEQKTPKRKTEEKNQEESTPKRRKEEKPERRKEEKPEKRKEEKPEKRKEEKPEKRKEEKLERRKEEKPERRRRKKAFGKLMEDVVLVISGFKNPLRGDIRTMALEMGAKYSADWEPHCTHLVCAYDNTPKFHQVKGKGKIVKKDWVERCHKDRKRYPWRRFALDKADVKKPESEEEVEAGEESDDQVASSSSAETPGNGRSGLKKGNSGDAEYDAATDDEEEKNVDTTDFPMPYLPDVFSLETFYVDPNLRERAALERYIVAYNGLLTETFSEDVNFYVTDRGGAPVELFRKKAPNLVAIKPSWIWEINSKQKRISTAPHLVN